jgi:hypothetical protein
MSDANAAALYLCLTAAAWFGGHAAIWFLT